MAFHQKQLTFQIVYLRVYLDDEVYEEAVFTPALSVVFQVCNKAYKMPLDNRSIRTLENLLIFYLNSESKPKQVLLPENKLGCTFFVFRCLHPPLDIKSICFDIIDG